jgi:hypothetical protein
MVLLGLGDQIDRYITHIVQGVRFIYEVIIEELGSYVVPVSGVMADVASLESQGYSEEAHEGGSLGLPSDHFKGGFEDFL